MLWAVMFQGFRTDEFRKESLMFDGWRVACDRIIPNS
jgi:hypothetical protein